jgi:hypothetical protein
LQIDTKHYEIDGLKIEWGKPLNEVRILLDRFEKFKPFGGWPNIRCKCPNAFGLAATAFEVRAPFEDRPVIQVQYELAPIKSGFLEGLHIPYLEQLENVFGKPVKSEKLYNKILVKKKYLSGAVVFNAQWLFNDIRISLSVYGDTRNNDSGLCAAGIFIDWIDEIKAAKPFREKSESFEKLIAAHISNDTVINKLKLQYKQRPFRVVHAELSDPYIAEKDDNLRASQLSLYKQELFQTPGQIQSKLEEDEICFYTIRELGKTFISNRWDTVFLTSTDENALNFYEVLPARGSGRRELELKELKIEDARGSDALLNLIQLIETDIGLKIQRQERYDD